MNSVSPAAGAVAWTEEVLFLLEQGFGVRFHLLDGATGELISQSGHQPAMEWQRYAELCREVARRDCPEFIDEEDPLLILAVPFGNLDGASCVAIATLAQRPARSREEVELAAARLGLSRRQAWHCIRNQSHGSAETLRRVAAMAIAQWKSGQQIRRMEREAQQISDHLAATYEEISLLHRLTHNLKISRSDEDLAAVALEWLSAVLPAESLAAYFFPVAQEDDNLTHKARTKPVLISPNRLPLQQTELVQLVQRIGRDESQQLVVLNPPVTEQPDWPCPQVRQLIAVPLAESDNLFGWLLAINHVDDQQFGTVEASLLSSVAAILGIHSGNIELYRQQSELLAGVVRALTSAIDAKDPYTCGHSDRVAQIAVRLAQELKCSTEEINTIYLSGLLHDIGKIGVNDAVLRKPGKLTESEYEHIKQHVEIGHRILYDLKKLGEVLPVVLHHHESWDGEGYPRRLATEAIPLSARIVAVADAFDAMGSNRPYRNGLPDEKIDEVFRVGAGKQWDPAVVAAFFRARDDLRETVRRAQEQVEVNPPSAW